MLPLLLLIHAAASLSSKYTGPGFRVVRCFPKLSRRDADKAVCDGRVKVNGRVAKPALRVKSGDVVTLDGRKQDWEAFAASLDENGRRFVVYNKPAGVTCTTDNNDRRSLRFQPALKRYFSAGRVFPVGRLDADSEGLVLPLELAPAANPLRGRGAEGPEVQENAVLHCDPGAAEDADADADAGTDEDADTELHADGPSKPDAAAAPSPAARFRQLRPYVGPLFVVYLAEYTMSTGATSTIDAHGVSRKRFYELASLVYQLGVLVSRSSGGCVRLRRLWTMAALQCANLAAMAAASYFDATARGVPWQALQALVFWEGLLGGAVYVNAFGRIHAEVPREDRELSLLVASCADSAGINCAAWLSLWLQCALDRRHGRATGSAWC